MYYQFYFFYYIHKNMILQIRSQATTKKITTLINFLNA